MQLCNCTPTFRRSYALLITFLFDPRHTLAPYSSAMCMNCVLRRSVLWNAAEFPYADNVALLANIRVSTVTAEEVSIAVGFILSREK